MSHLTNSTTHVTPTARRSRSAASRLRRGYVTVWAIMIIMISIVTLMLVVNWTYLVLASRHTLRLTDSLSLTAVYQLLDEAVLTDSQNFPATQANDITAANNEILTPATGMLARNNAAAGPALRPTAAQVTITPGRVDNANAVVTNPGNFTAAPGAGQPYNTLRVEVLRDPNGLNPVQLMFRGQGSPNAAKITAGSYATLDSRVVGFRPTAAVRSPVAPLALLSGDWFTTRATGANDTQLPDGRFELDFVLLPPSGMGTANSAMISLNNLPFNVATATNQISNGIGPGDVTGGMLGPLAPTAPLSVDAQQSFMVPDSTSIANAFNAVAGSTNPRRVFPIYNSFSDPANIVGFIGARVVNASVFNPGGGQRVRVRLQPDFIVHSTVVTQRNFPGATSVPENLYIHKIRLTR